MPDKEDYIGESEIGKSESRMFEGKKITFYNCRDCKMVSDRTATNRPNGKFCDPECKAYVDSKDKEDYGEPLRFEQDEPYNPEIYDKDGYAIATVSGTLEIVDTDMARRFCAAMNAVKGISTEDLESGLCTILTPAKEAREGDCEWIHECGHMCAECSSPHGGKYELPKDQDLPKP